MFGDLTTVTMSYHRGWDRVYKDLKDAATGAIINDSKFNGGLGFAIARRLIEVHGGSLKISSVPGETTTADLFFPVWTPES